VPTYATYHENDDANGHADDNVDVLVDFVEEGGPAALKVVALIVGLRVSFAAILNANH
jgi:hypothetical protein